MKDVKARRELLLTGNPNGRITVIVDNMMYVTGTNKHDVVRWDDENEILYVLKFNEDHMDYSRPFKIQTFDYSDIQCIELDTNKNGIKEAALACGFTEEEIADTIKEYTTINL